MKELSIEEKARHYDEAIKYAYYLINERCKKGTNGSFHRADLDKMFPELAESKDERIRKELISYIKQTNYDNSHTWNGINLNIFIDWLEKKGEHQEYPKNVIDNAISFLANRNDGMPEKEAKDIVNAIITVLNPSYWPKQGKQKPTWSEEDGEEFKQLLNILHANGYESFDNWLKSIKERVQPKQDWSEEDERIHKVVLEILNSWSKGTIGGEIIPPNTDRYINWFKSLKERYTWKPSDEQMKALEHFVRSIGESGYASPYDNNTKLVYSLLSELKKLREE